VSITRGKIVAFYSSSGGVGKTLVAASLAACYRQQENARVLLVDAGFPLPGDAPAAMGVERAKALSEMVPLLARLTPEIFASYLVTAPSGVAVIALVSDVLQARLVTLEVVKKLFELATDAYDLIVIDMASGCGPLTARLVDHADEVCVVSDATVAGLTRARHAVDYLRSLQVPAESLMYCINRVPESTGVTPDKAQRLAGVRVTVMLPEDTKAIQAATSRRTPLAIANPRHAFARGIDRLGREIATRRLRARTRESGSLHGTEEQLTEEDVRELKLKIHRRLIDEIDLRKADLSYLRDPVKLQEFRTRVEAKVLTLLDEEGSHVTLRETRRRIVKDVLDEALGLGPLEDLLADETVTEIMVNRHDQIYVERGGKLQATDVRFLNVEQLRGVIERIVAPLGRRIDEKVPMVDARLLDGSRVNAIVPPLALRGPALTIRKFSRKLLSVDDLVRFGSFTRQMATLLGAAVQARMNIVISGGTGSGKTTLLNVLASFIPEDERILTIEDAAELQLPQEHVVTLEARSPNIEGEGAITIRDLVRNALRMRPDRIVVGECRGGEALDMLQAMNTGHDGSLTTVHANSPRDALSRLETMALMAGLDLPSRAIRDQIASAVNFVIQQSRLQDGTRRVTHISEVTGQDGNTFTTADVFVFRQTGVSADGRVAGQYVPTGYVPAFVDTLSRQSHIKVPREIFLHQTA
jgi:pilus assembly protein CpaF